ncbi:hypothetical protein FXF51_21765 [Nonomuraea sp. PA05]|uniref:thiopeptide-type bacteriocin biosynthesis protein n=1 Tax=Nonomuraea sp. PA05 TaxID=2604466 RepID=UPI0011D73BE1|nr:thiopeptide-type bacteriocin biosynthesis protein [Nonomuraea sp. PA05]TYB64347.1 hypothetical protein FXF51_21765 [Nonomuraea sp. PA05]
MAPSPWADGADCPHVHPRPPSTWLHYGLIPAPDRRPALYAELRATATALLDGGRAREFFFMHKPPGLRVRFQSAHAGTHAGTRAGLDGELSEVLDGWRRDGLLREWRGGVYEPEEYLFGGPVSMAGVHRVFTADSLAWLGHHAAPAGVRAGQAWTMSLPMMRAVLDSLDIAGWEDLDVWDRLRRQTGRRLADPGRLPAGAVTVASALRAAWSAPHRLVAALPPHAAELVERYREAVMAAGRRWLDSYFTVGQPAVGPREAAAFVIVFHWNRAGLSAARQALIVEALMARPGETLAARPGLGGDEALPAGSHGDEALPAGSHGDEALPAGSHGDEALPAGSRGDEAGSGGGEAR